MKKLVYVVAICVATMFAGNAKAQSLGDLFNALSGMLGSTPTQQQQVEKPVYPTEKQLAGTWVYSQPEMAYEGDDALAAIAVSTIKSQIPSLLKQYGIVEGQNYAIIKGSKITAVSGDRKEKASYTYIPSTGKAIITGEYNGNKIIVTGYLTIKDGNITVLFDAQELLAIASQSQQFKENSALQMAASVISTYPGVQVGLTARPK